MTEVECCSDRLIFVEISANPVDIVILQVCMSTTTHIDDEIGKMYDEITDILHKEGKGQVNTIVMVDFNSIEL